MHNYFSGAMCFLCAHPPTQLAQRQRIIKHTTINQRHRRGGKLTITTVAGLSREKMAFKEVVPTSDNDEEKRM